jgi:hypothetical protein
MAHVVVSSSSYSNTLSVADHLTSRRVSLALVADGKLLSPAEFRAQIMRPLVLMKTEAWFFARRSPDFKLHREEPPPPLGHMLTQFSTSVPVRVMLVCVATACCRLVTAPGGMHVMGKKTWRWAELAIKRVTRGRVKKVQVQLQRRACFISDNARYSKRSPSLRCAAPNRSRSGRPFHEFQASSGRCRRPHCSQTRHLICSKKQQHSAPVLPSCSQSAIRQLLRRL